MSQWQPARPQEWHDQMAEMLIIDPTVTNEQLAIALELNVQSVALVRRSDMFKLHYRNRLAKFQDKNDERIRERLEGRITRVADSALENLELQLEQQRNLLLSGQVVKEMRDTRETAETVLSALGYSRKGAPPQPPAGQVNNNSVFIVDATLLASAREKMRALTNVIEGSSDTPALPAPQELSGS